MNENLSIKNAKLILADSEITGTLNVQNGMIADMGSTGDTGLDFDGDYLVPGLVELHTDHLESHYRPRPGVFWDPMAALHAHDAQVTSSGITTVFDAVRIGSDTDMKNMGEHVDVLVGAITKAKAEKRLRSDHLIHLRCELSSHDALEQFEQYCQNELVKLASLMDHTPGQRQFMQLEQYYLYYQGKTGMSDAEMEQFIAARIAEHEQFSGPNRQAIVKRGHEIGLALASHDDATAEHVDEAKRDGVAIAEFPTTIEAAKASRKANLAILMGAPNVVRGKSHSGNISATDLAKEDLLDVLSSDYVPFSLMQGAFKLAENVEQITLPQAIAKVSLNPARAAGLDDRGELAVGKKADFARVHLPEDGVPIVRAVWRDGQRVI
ncbi:alpha-D-ribose 1-methylphosphonate 5-triphosphate diphosphatase [Maritalea mobilis]|uniref:Alpha-D-ribose 1-methylphosphonate 5-triphosphate diphosphatase n=1 Tax=Maritalea mobilis TaxID=483324 RepID=A0A4R6VIT5_9HYPH|nr:alpha-D-ribose 1-methylphosphonate 5-triphosphate diphosphatase [Maritalea mobilis]TDQ61549.1 alpha-D-ribose 1-methylphosphonate 5-triphosphate diphosphatase [Maritalea mobilis]